MARQIATPTISSILEAARARSRQTIDRLSGMDWRLQDHYLQMLTESQAALVQGLSDWVPNVDTNEQQRQPLPAETPRPRRTRVRRGIGGRIIGQGQEQRRTN